MCLIVLDVFYPNWVAQISLLKQVLILTEFYFFLTLGITEILRCCRSLLLFVAGFSVMMYHKHDS